MNDRLRDQTRSADTAVRRAARWLAAVGPVASSDEAMARVRARLSPPRTRRLSSRRPLLFALATAVVVLVLAAVAAAMVAAKLDLDLWGGFEITGHAIIVEHPHRGVHKTHQRKHPSQKEQLPPADRR